MQRLNIYEHVVNLKYGFGIELNNYRYTENIKYETGLTKVIWIPLAIRRKARNRLCDNSVMLNFISSHRRDGWNQRGRERRIFTVPVKN
jgi:hypothetical protein